MSNYFLIFILSLFLTAFLVLIIKKVALRFNIIDKPQGARKIHKRAIPLLGGLAVFLGFFIVLFFVREELVAGKLEYHHWLGFFTGACFLMIGGFLDDKYSMPAGIQIIWPLLAVASIIAGGVGISKISNPLDGLIFLDSFKISLWQINNTTYYIVILADLFTLIWLMGMMYTTKLLDGVDGLVSGMAAIGGLIIFLFTTTTQYYQPDIALASLIFSAACLGFLVFNWHPAKIFLGEGGSLLLGYILGVLAIISGGKVAIALLIMGIPILDVGWTILRRLYYGKNPFKFADKKHLHHRLLDLGLGQRKTVLFYYIMALAFGGSALFLQSGGKFYALLLLFIIMLAIVVTLSFYGDRVKTN
jgi:UDP-GlcNAc:undecaprenyl-phosphate GlcNAc-1-phosphate transferase